MQIAMYSLKLYVLQTGKVESITDLLSFWFQSPLQSLGYIFYCTCVLHISLLFFSPGWGILSFFDHRCSVRPFQSNVILRTSGNSPVGLTGRCRFPPAEPDKRAWVFISASSSSAIESLSKREMLLRFSSGVI